MKGRLFDEEEKEWEGQRVGIRAGIGLCWDWRGEGSPPVAVQAQRSVSKRGSGREKKELRPEGELQMCFLGRVKVLWLGEERAQIGDGLICLRFKGSKDCR